MRDISTKFGFGLAKISITASIYDFLPPINCFLSSAHSVIAGKCLCRVRDMMTTNDGNSKC